VRSRTSSRAIRLATPKPPPTRRANAAALPDGERLALPPASEAEDDRPRGFRSGGGPVLRRAVDDDHLASGEVTAEPGHRTFDSLLLVARGDEDGQLTHWEPCPRGA
jgi:hypothetical protein